MRLPERLPTRILTCAGLSIPILLASACAGSDAQNTLSPQGHITAVIAGLFWPVFWIAVGVFVLVEALLIFVLVRFRSRPGGPVPKQIHGNTTLELTWTAIPALMLLGVAIPTVATLVHIDSTPANSMQINVIAHQWWWEFDYPQQDVNVNGTTVTIPQQIVTADEMHIPAGVPIHVSLHSADVIHSFWVPVLAGKQDVIPNHDGGMWFNAYHPGTYDGECAQFCGEQHALMLYRVEADSAGDFSSWVQDQTSAASLSSQAHAVLTGSSSSTDPGAQALINDGCTGCHTIDGTNAKGTVGPNLTHFASRKWFEEMDNNPQDVQKWISGPQQVKPGNDMKIGHLSDQDVSALVALLTNLK